MLEDISSAEYEDFAFRLVSQAKQVEKLRSLNLAPDQIDEMIELLRDRGVTDKSSEILDGPFEDKLLYRARQTRFSDGTLRVFYSALESETVEQEIRYWHLKPLLEGQVQ